MHVHIVHICIALGLVACRGASDRPGAQPTNARDAVPTIGSAARTSDRAVATAIVAAGDTRCAVLSDKTVRCWGDNMFGQLGDGTYNDSALPVTPAVRTVAQLALSATSACALLADESVSCWGGIAWTRGPSNALVPTGVVGATGVQQLFLGDLQRFACARLRDESLACWGHVDAHGHVVPDAEVRGPTAFEGLDHVVALGDSWALREDGSVYTWAADGVPTRRALANVVSLAERTGTLCGRDAAGHVACIGIAPLCSVDSELSSKHSPESPQDRTVTLALPPAMFVLGETSEKLGAVDRWCVVTTDGALQCGDGCGKVAPPMPGLEHVVQVSGWCARLVDGNVTCWRDHEVMRVAGIAHATAIAADHDRGCAIVDRGQVMCWSSDGRAEPVALR